MVSRHSAAAEDRSDGVGWLKPLQGAQYQARLRHFDTSVSSEGSSAVRVQLPHLMHEVDNNYSVRDKMLPVWWLLSLALGESDFTGGLDPPPPHAPGNMLPTYLTQED